MNVQHVDILAPALQVIAQWCMCVDWALVTACVDWALVTGY